MRQTTFHGMLPRLHPRVLPDTTSARALDADLSRETLRPFRADRKVAEGAPGGKLWAEACCYKVLPCEASVARYTQGCGRVFSTGVLPYPTQAATADWCASSLQRLGMTCPPSAPTVGHEAVPTTDHGSMPRAFMYTYRNQFKEESAGSPPSGVQIVQWNAGATVTGFTPPPAELRAVEVVIYMLQAGVTSLSSPGQSREAEWFEVGTVPVEGDLSTVVFTYTAGTRLGKLYLADEVGAPPDDLKDIQDWGTDQLVGVSGQSILFSEPHMMHVWPDKYRLQLNSPLVRFVATQRWGYALTCSAPEVVSMQQGCNHGGCHEVTTLDTPLPLLGREAVATADGAVFYASRTGVVMLSGTRAKVISESLWTQDQWEALMPQTMRFIVHQGYLFMSNRQHAFRMRVPTTAFAEVTHTELTELSIRADSWYQDDRGELYFLDAAGGIYQWARGDTFKPYRYESRTWTSFQLMGLAAVKVTTDTNQVEVSVVEGDMTRYTGPVPWNKPMLLRAGRSATETRFILTGTAEVSTFAAARSIPDLTTR